MSLMEGGPQGSSTKWSDMRCIMRDEFAVTGTLTVTFVKPVPIERPLIGRTRIVGREGRRVFVEAS